MRTLPLDSGFTLRLTLPPPPAPAKCTCLGRVGMTARQPPSGQVPGGPGAALCWPRAPQAQQGPEERRARARGTRADGRALLLCPACSDPRPCALGPALPRQHEGRRDRAVPGSRAGSVPPPSRSHSSVIQAAGAVLPISQARLSPLEARPVVGSLLISTAERGGRQRGRAGARAGRGPGGNLGSGRTAGRRRCRQNAARRSRRTQASSCACLCSPGPLSPR